MTGVHVGGMCGRGCMAGGVHGRGHTWQGACMTGQHALQGYTWQGGSHDMGHAWQEGAYTEGACVVKGVHAGEMATEAGSTYPTGMYSCTTSNKVAAR